MKLTAALRCLFVLIVLAVSASITFAQFSGNVTGVVQDATGATVAKATVQIVNTGTQVSQTTETDASGIFNFVSLAPGTYELSADATGFAKTVETVVLTTSQTLNVTLSLSLKSVTTSVQVTEQAPVVNTVETRNQLTLEHQAVDELPVAGRSIVGLATLAPGVTGLGTTADNAPGSNVDNYSTETAVDASANGQGQMSNMWVVDGLDVTSGIRQGILNLTPNPDSVQEIGIQVNTFSSEYSRASGIETVMTTKSGTDQFHGFAADYYYNRTMFARTHTTGPDGYLPFHGNNMAFGIGGPIIPHHQFFFFFDVEPLRSEQSTNASGQTFADPAFVSFAQTNFPNTVGTGILTKYVPSNLTGVALSQTAQQFFYPVSPSNPAGGCPAGQTTIPVGAAQLPCTLPFIDSGDLSAKALRNGTQYFGRIDKYFSKDRVYASYYRTVLTYGAPGAIPQFSAANNQNWEYALQGNWTHTFSPTTLNEAVAGVSRVEGTLGSGAADYTVPNISTGGINVGFGAGFAQGDFIQKNYHWRDVLTHVQGAHTLKFGYEGWYGTDVEPFQGPYSTPSFSFQDLTTLVQDQPRNESGVMYNPATGQPVLWSWDAASRTWGAFAMDVWKLKPNLTVTLGVRYDDSGNPWSKSANTVFGNFYLGPGSTMDEQVANGFAKETHNALNHAVDGLISPRVAIAWDPTGHGVWAVRGGFGIYNDWLTSANVQEEFRGNPPGDIIPTFVPGGVPGVSGPPIFVLGTGNTPPFGFTNPAFTAGLNAQGGVTGANFGIGGINPNLRSPKAAVWSGTIERSIATKYAVSVGYSGSHSYGLVGGSDVAGGVSYGVNINSFAGDLVQNNSLVPTRLNPSFGSISYGDNNRYGNYNALVFDLRGRYSRGFFDFSYTHSESKDDAGVYPTADNPAQYYGPSPWDAPNRFSLVGNYEIHGLNGGEGFVGHATGGWGLTGTTIFQSGYPFTVINTNSFNPTCEFGATNCPSNANPIIGLAANSGDYNADGNNLDYPNVANYSQGNSKSAFLNGVFSDPSTQFTQPTLGTEGNEKQNLFRGPNFFETDAAIYKDNRFKERFNFQIRFEFYNLFNRTNLENMDTNNLDANFGKATGSLLGRWWQIGGRFTF
ncbi:MAG: TonB-dependent receptor [Candidatus Acidiferrales bacterium]